MKRCTCKTAARRREITKEIIGPSGDPAEASTSP
jgi:hypothetical protein